MPTLAILALYVYGILLILGGTMGYAKARSLGSLVAGSVGGLLALLFGWLSAHDMPEAKIAAILLALLLSLIMGWRFLKTRKAMPALPIIILSLLVAVLQLT
jgi:uncharacterized membrane protein (UPF0136 family)